MTNEDYLEAYHELTTKILPEIAIRLGRGDTQDGIDLLAQLQSTQSDMWTSYMDQASAAVNP